MIFAEQNRGSSEGAIGRLFGRPASTICREPMRGRQNDESYHPATAQRGLLQRFRYWMPKSLWILILIHLAFLAGWYTAVAILQPSDLDFMTRATSNYFQTMSELGRTNLSSYYDCTLAKADDASKLQGIAMFGLCRAEDETTTYHYSIAMGRVGNFVYSDFEEVRK